MKYAYISSISPGYMFAMNANMNSNKYYGTNAEVHLLYHNAMEKDYMARCETAFPFKIKWIRMSDFGGGFHNSKYQYAISLKDEYDAVCLIDADLFICCNTKGYFEKAANEKILISATHVWSGMTIDQLPFKNPETLVDRGQAYLADFPVFINPRFGEELLDCWNENTPITASKEFFHPLVAFNRCICKTLSPEQLMALDGELWVCDKNLWEVDYIREGDKMFNNSGERINAIHNKWWKYGRQSGEWLAHRWVKDNNTEVIKRLDRGERNMNAIKDFMAWFNDMTPATRRDDYVKEKIDRRKYLQSLI